MSAPAAPAKSRTRLVIWIVLIATLGPIVAAIVIRIFIMEAFKVPAGSMMPTVFVGDHLFVSKSHTTATRGAVFVFKYPENPAQDFIKRVAAVGGDTLEEIDGRVVVNGVVAPQCHVGPFLSEGMPQELYLEKNGDHVYGVLHARRAGEQACQADADCASPERCLHSLCITEQRGPYTVKQGEFWVLGDNRDNSHDSPRWAGGKGMGVPVGMGVGEAMFVWFSTIDGRVGLNLQGLPRLDGRNAGLQSELDRCAAELGK